MKKASSRRYAQAVFETARSRNELDKWLSDLKDIAKLRADEALVTWLESPKIPTDAKATLLKKQLVNVNPLALNLAYLLLARGRFSIVGDIADEYERLLNSYRGIAPAEVLTAVPLDDEDMKRLSEHLSTITGKKVVVKSAVDSSLIGGIVARVGGKLLDGSTRSKLLALKQQIERQTGT